MAPKRAHIVIREEQFRSRESEEAYTRLKDWEFTDSKILRQDRLSYPISDYFVNTPLLFILCLVYPFNSDLIREFYANLVIDASRTSITSRISRRNVIITSQDIGRHLCTSIEGPKAHDIALSLHHNWTSINLVLRNSNYHQHISTVSGLTKDARVIQHVLRHTIIPKAGDRTNITPLLSVVTYFCMTNTSFDVGDLIIRYLENVCTYIDPKAKRRHNLALGHIISHILLNKYDIAVPSTFDHQPSFFTDSSFHILMGKEKGKGKRPAEEEEEEEEEYTRAQGEPSAPPPSTSGDDISSRLGRLELRLEGHIRRSEERWKKLDDYCEEARAWRQAQDASRRRGPPPSDD